MHRQITLHNFQTQHTQLGPRLFQAAPKRKKTPKHDNGDILLKGLVPVFRKLDVRLWTEHTVSVSESKLAQPQGGIKSVVLSQSVLWRKRGRGFRLN